MAIATILALTGKPQTLKYPPNDADSHAGTGEAVQLTRDHFESDTRDLQGHG
jgi:hypothetical protein